MSKSRLGIPQTNSKRKFDKLLHRVQTARFKGFCSAKDYKIMEAIKKGLTVQELCDRLTVLSHNGHAQAVVRHVTGDLVKAVTGVEMVGDEIALITSRGE